MSTVLITINDKQDKTNVITVAWHTTISKKPPLYGISVAPSRYSYELIKKSKEYVINFASFNLLEKIHFCGTHSGRKINKIDETKLTLIPSEKIKTPSIEECYAHFECKLDNSFNIGDHRLFIGLVLNARVNEEIFNGNILDNKKTQTCFYLGNNTYSKINSSKKRF
jgi:flavin reductase (DIM6/NTAB) family NADH-FMN oxidoreductase RutF